MALRGPTQQRIKTVYIKATLYIKAHTIYQNAREAFMQKKTVIGDLWADFWGLVLNAFLFKLGFQTNFIHNLYSHCAPKTFKSKTHLASCPCGHF